MDKIYKPKVSVKAARDIDHTNAYRVTVVNWLDDTSKYTVWTNENGNGLWIDGWQAKGTAQFSAGSDPAAAIRNYFTALHTAS